MNAPEPAGLDRTLRVVIRFGLYALLIFAPLPFGSVRPGPVLGIELIAAVLGTVSVVVAIRRPGDVPGTTRMVLVTAFMLLAIGVIQMIPAPDGIVSALAGPTAEIRSRVFPLLESSSLHGPLSLTSPGTLASWLRLAAYALIGFATAISFTRARHFRTAAIVVTASAAFQGLYGSYEYLSGHQHIFGYHKLYYLDSATGTFINRNHFAGFLAVALPVALWLVLNRADAGRGARSLRERFLHLSGASGFAVLFGGAASGVICAGVLLSRSRGGLAVALVSIVLVLAVFARRRRLLMIVAAVVLIPVLFLMWQQVATPGDRFATESGQLVTLNSRLPVWIVSATIARDYPLMGSGMGTFEHVFESYRPPEIRGRWDRAHNDWLQLVVEMGWFAGLVTLTGLVFLMRSAWRSFRVGAVDGALAACIAAGVAAAALHAIVDFSVRIPAYAVQLAVLIGLLCALDRRVRDADTVIHTRAVRRDGGS